MNNDLNQGQQGGAGGAAQEDRHRHRRRPAEAPFERRQADPKEERRAREGDHEAVTLGGERSARG